jgi:hypothetical protein
MTRVKGWIINNFVEIYSKDVKITVCLFPLDPVCELPFESDYMAQFNIFYFKYIFQK